MKARTYACSDTLTVVFSALADPTRRQILRRLAEGDASVLELSEPFSITQPAVSQHLKVLERAGLVTRWRRGTARLSRLQAGPLRDASTWLADYRQFWAESHDRLDVLLLRLQDVGADGSTIDPPSGRDPKTEQAGR